MRPDIEQLMRIAVSLRRHEHGRALESKHENYRPPHSQMECLYCTRIVGIPIALAQTPESTAVLLKQLIIEGSHQHGNKNMRKKTVFCRRNFSFPECAFSSQSFLIMRPYACF